MGFFPFKMCTSIPLIPAAFKIHDSEKTGKERQGHLYDPLHIPSINVSSIVKKAKLNQAFSPLSGHVYQPSLHID